MRSKLTRYMINLEHFAAVVEYGTISAASSALNLSQPALTRSIQRLEDVLGTRLLCRMPRGVSATEAGTVLLRHIASVRAELDQAETAVQIIKGRSNGRIACGAGSVTMSRILPQVLGRIRDKLKMVQVSLTDGRTLDLLAKLRSGELDIVIGIEQPEHGNSDLRCERLIEEHFGFFVRTGHPLVRDEPRSLNSIVSQEKFVMPILASSPVERALDCELERLGAVLNPYRIETLSLPVFSHLVLQEDYFALSSSLIFEAELRGRTVRWLSGDWHFPSFATCLYRRRNDYDSPSVKAFVNEVRAVIPSLISQAPHHRERVQNA